MAIFDKFERLAKERRQLQEHGAGLDPLDTVMDKVLSPTEAIVEGRRTILAGTNNYLGLTFDPDCVKAAAEAAWYEGTGTTGSRMANGTYSGHAALEQELAGFFGRGNAIVFSTGYQANLGILSSLIGSEDTILLDADCHASIYDGARLSGAEIFRFRHNCVEDLERRLKRLSDRDGDILVLVEGLYSMLGDRAPLEEIAEASKAWGAYLLVDEAHSLGVLGEKGRGRAEEAGVEEAVDFVIGTFSKSLGAIGGYCVSDYEELDLLRYTSRPYIFTASPSPSTIASTREALRILRERPALRVRLWENAGRLYHHLDDLGFRLGPEVSPVVAPRLPRPEDALALWKGLLEAGVYVNLVLPPATPDEASLLRCSVSAGHSPAQMDAICAAFSELRDLVHRA